MRVFQTTNRKHKSYTSELIALDSHSQMLAMRGIEKSEEKERGISQLTKKKPERKPVRSCAACYENFCLACVTEETS